MMRPFANTHAKRQSGAVLFVALVFLVLLTLLALTATGTSILQERMTGGLRNQQLGFMGVESGLRGGESFLWNISFDGTNPLPPCAQGETGTCAYGREIGTGLPQSKAQDFRTQVAWLDAQLSSAGVREHSGVLTALTGTAKTASLVSKPRYMIEELGDDVPPSIGGQSGAIDPLGGGANTNKLYRVTSRSQGGSAAVVRVAESVFSASAFRNIGTNVPSAGGGGGTP